MPRIGQTMPQQYLNSRLWRRNTSTYSLLTSQSTQRAPLEAPQQVSAACILPILCIYANRKRREWSIMTTAGEGSEFYCQVRKSHGSLVPTSHWPALSHMAPDEPQQRLAEVEQPQLCTIAQATLGEKTDCKT